MATLSFFQNRTLKRVMDMQAALVVKRGHLSKHATNAWHHGFGTGPSYYRGLLVYPTLAIDGAEPVLAAKRAREQLPASHAQLPGRWTVLFNSTPDFDLPVYRVLFLSSLNGMRFLFSLVLCIYSSI